MNANARPLAEIVELLSQKWIMRIIWELRGDPLTFRSLQQACENISPTVLNNRLKRLESAFLVQKSLTASGYELTEPGVQLLELYKPLNTWAEEWQQQRLRAESK